MPACGKNMVRERRWQRIVRRMFCFDVISCVGLGEIRSYDYEAMVPELYTATMIAYTTTCPATIGWYRVLSIVWIQRQWLRR
eukprot:scaffold30550_cov66-Phaeocystis_antarctica.AAC.10